MALYLNQIFYKCNKFDNMNSLQRINPYILNQPNLVEFIERWKMEQTKMIPASHPDPLFSQFPKEETWDYQPTGTSSHLKIKDSICLVLTPFVREQRKNKDERGQMIPASPLAPLFSQIEKETPPPKREIYYPSKEDSLFWCMFIAFYGYNEYEYIGKKYANKELEEKQKIMEHIKKTPKIIKETNKKITNVLIQEILSELMIQKETNLVTFIAFVFYYKKKVIIQNDHLFLFYSYNKDVLDPLSITDENINEYIVLNYHSDNNQYGIVEEPTKEQIVDIIENKYCIENTVKPIKGISCYKVAELEEMANKLNINTTSKKADLYNDISESCKWVKDNKIKK